MGHPIAIRVVSIIIMLGSMVVLQGCAWFQNVADHEQKGQAPKSLEQLVSEINRRYASPHTSSRDWYGHMLSLNGSYNRPLGEQLKAKGLLIPPQSLLAEAHKLDDSRIASGHGQEGVLMPVLTLTRDGYLIPDIELTEQLYRWLKDDTSMNLKSLGASLKLYRAFVAAVVQNCPIPSNNPSPVCQFQSWIGWSQMKSLRNGRVYEDKRFREQLKKWPDVNYLVWPQMSVYLNQSAVLMKYAPSSEPLINITFEQRKERLKSIQGVARIDVVPVIRFLPATTSAWCEIKPLMLDARLVAGEVADDIEIRLKWMQQGFGVMKSLCSKAVNEFKL